jgi:biofilm PGA synthesis N-glycosyltransferase PgaC
MLCHRPAGSTQSATIGLYWLYERWIRLSESHFDSTVGATGAYYALRRHLWVDLPQDTLIDDFVVPMHVVRSGYRVVLEPSAIAVDVLQDTAEGEFRRKVRTLAGNFQALARYPWLRTRENRLWFQLISHKVLRLVTPIFLLLALVSSLLLLGTAMFRFLAALQIALYVLALVGHCWPATRRYRLVSVPVVFVYLNLAALAGAYQYFNGGNVHWHKT